MIQYIPETENVICIHSRFSMIDSSFVSSLLHLSSLHHQVPTRERKNKSFIRNHSIVFLYQEKSSLQLICSRKLLLRFTSVRLQKSIAFGNETKKLSFRGLIKRKSEKTWLDNSSMNLASAFDAWEKLNFTLDILPRKSSQEQDS